MYIRVCITYVQVINIHIIVHTMYIICIYIQHIINMRMYMVRTCYKHGTYMYVHGIYLYSTAGLYNDSSEGVNLFCCCSSILGRNPPSNAAACDILLPVVATGTGSFLSKVCSLSKPDCSWLSKPLINLLMASSVSAASGLASKKSSS